MKRSLWLLPLVALASTAVAAPTAASAAPRPAAAAAQQGIGIRLLDASTQRRDDPRAQIYINDFVPPGTTFTRHVEVSDFTPRPVHLLVYAAPAAIDGQAFQIGARGARSELVDWMTVAPGAVDLAPGQSKTVAVTFRVPRSAAKGERYGAIVAELPAAAPKPGTVSVASRVGVRVYLDVGRGGEPPSAFTVSTLTAKKLPDGTPVVSATVTNTGGRALDLSGTLQLSDGPGGLRAGPFPVRTVPTLGVGKTGAVDVPLDKQTPNGPWLATMRLQSGYVVHVVRGRITFPATAGAAAKPVKAHEVPLTKDRRVLVPIAIGLILALLIALVLFLLWRRRRRRDDDEQRSGGATPPAIPAQRARPRDGSRTRQ